jgi:hypothetical protein
MFYNIGSWWSFLGAPLWAQATSLASQNLDLAMNKTLDCSPGIKISVAVLGTAETRANVMKLFMSVIYQFS